MNILKTNPPLQAELLFKLLNKLLVKRGEDRVSLTSLLPALSMVVEGTPSGSAIDKQHNLDSVIDLPELYFPDL